MKNRPTLPAMIRVFRRLDRSGYILMEFALVSKGHYVGWGQLYSLNSQDFEKQGQGFILHSLETFSSRNGDHRGKRLKLVGQEPFHVGHHLVSIEGLASSSLTLVPYRRGERQHEQMLANAVVIDANASPECFLRALDEAFARSERAT